LLRVDVSQVTPAGRLHHLLAEIQTKPDQQSMVQAWSEVLQIPEHQRAELLRTYALVVGLPDEVEAQVLKIDSQLINLALVTRWRDKVVSAFEVDFARNVTINNFTGRYDRETLAYLEMCDDALRRHLPGRSPLQESDLEHITALVDELEVELNNDPAVDPELRAFLLLHTQAMSQAVRDVPVRGSAGLEEALDQALGDAFVRRPDLFRRAGPERAGKFLAIVQAVVLALQIALTGLQITQAAEGQPQDYVTVQVDIKQAPALPAAGPISPPSPESAAPDGQH
jgi:hypothetical protein